MELEFEALLNNIFGPEFIEAFRYKRPAGWVDLMIAFESRKRAATPYKNNALNVSLPFSFIDYYKKKKVRQSETDPNLPIVSSQKRYLENMVCLNYTNSKKIGPCYLVLLVSTKL